MIPIAYAPRIDSAHPAMIFCAPRGLSLATEAAMGMERWNPKRETTRQEEFLLKRLHRTRKLFGFLRRHRHELFDDIGLSPSLKLPQHLVVSAAPSRPRASDTVRGQPRVPAGGAGRTASLGGATCAG